MKNNNKSVIKVQLLLFFCHLIGSGVHALFVANGCTQTTRKRAHPGKANIFFQATQVQMSKMIRWRSPGFCLWWCWRTSQDRVCTSRCARAQLCVRTRSKPANLVLITFLSVPAALWCALAHFPCYKFPGLPSAVMDDPLVFSPSPKTASRRGCRRGTRSASPNPALNR